MSDEKVKAGWTYFDFRNPSIRRRPRTILKVKTRHRWSFLGFGTSPTAEGQLLYRHVYDPPVTMMEGDKMKLTFKLIVNEESGEYNVEEVESYVFREFDPPV